MLTANTPCEGRCALHDLSPDLCFLYHDRFWTREPAEVQMLRRRKQNADASANSIWPSLSSTRAASSGRNYHFSKQVFRW